MFDIGWMELLLIGIVALIVVGPKDLPVMFRTVGQFMGKARGMAREFQRSMEQAADESGLKDVSRDLHSVNRNLTSASGSARKYAEGLGKDRTNPKPGKKPQAAGDAPPAGGADPAGGEPAGRTVTPTPPRKPTSTPTKAAHATGAPVGSGGDAPAAQPGEPGAGEGGDGEAGGASGGASVARS
jgi:sec-independent protein translocase protein TatB